MFTPTTLRFDELFREPSMFDSCRNWQKAGFEVVGEGEESNIMVASHPSAPGYLFKKYSKKVSLKDQRKNYQRRIEGAQKLSAFIAEHQLTRIVAPQKYLHELPSAFSRKDVSSYVLVVERMDLLKSSASKQQFRQLDNEGLRQLCLVLAKFQGLDSGVRNVPFTENGQIAFIDTERWSSTKKEHLHRIREYLSEEQRAYAETLF
jgi:hypothetical protein